MQDLIERLQAATEGSRELDAEIHCAITGRITHSAMPKGFTMVDQGDMAKNSRAARSEFIHKNRGPAPHYSTSLDAAVSLATDRVVSWSIGDSPGGPTAWVLLDDGTEINGFPDLGKGTPAICACIAFLQARHTQGEG